MSPSFEERIERKVDKLLENDAKQGRVLAVHTEKISNLEKTQTNGFAKGWSIIMLIVSSFIGAIASHVMSPKE